MPAPAVRLALAGVIAIAAVGFAAGPGAPTASAGCAWLSRSTPPASIRVLRVATGRISTVDFRRYVQKVVAKEWGDSLPWEVQRAGAVAAKQYGWHKALYPRWTKSGACYHVRDSTSDQLFRPSATVSDRMLRAVSSTWGITVWRDGRFISTAYRRGYPGPCAYDVDGRRLYAASARRCANRRGWSAERILTVYYRANLR